MQEVLSRLVDSRRRDRHGVPRDVDGAYVRIPVPEVDERYSPLLDILPLQRLTLALAVVKGLDPTSLQGITKVTPMR